MLGPGRCLVPVYIDVSIVVSPKMKTLLMVRREPKGGGEMSNNFRVYYTLAIIEDEVFSYFNDGMGEERWEFNSIEEAEQSRKSMDCPEGISILKITEEVVR